MRDRMSDHKITAPGCVTRRRIQVRWAYSKVRAPSGGSPLHTHSRTDPGRARTCQPPAFEFDAIALEAEEQG